MEKKTLPALIENWIEMLRNPNNPRHVKENVVMMMENVQMACLSEIQKYRSRQQERLDRRPTKTKVRS